MLSERELSAAIGRTAYDDSGNKIGTVEHFFVDDRSGAATWVAVTTGLFGTRTSVVPAADATFTDGNLRLPVTAATVKSAPHVGGVHLDPAEEAQLRQHYGLTADGGAPVAPPTQEMPAVAPPVPAPSATSPASAPAAVSDRGAGSEPPATTETRAATDGGMVRSEERLRVGTEQVAATRMRLVKYVVTEDVQITVPIRREEIRIEEVPLGAVDTGPGESLVPAGQAPTPSVAPGLPDEIILHTERPVVSVEVVATERVRLRTEVVEGQETVSGQVQREQIVVDETPTRRINPS